MDSKIYNVYLTYKTYDKIMKDPNAYNLCKSYVNLNWCPTHYVYMNMMCGWTEEECDNVIYLQEVTD